MGLLLALTLVAAPAWAHVSLLGSSPVDGARLAAVPDTAVLRFSSPIATPASVVATGPGGADVAAAAPVVAGAEVSLALSGAGEGTYTVAYRVLSTDGHQLSGAITFQVGTGPGATTTTSAPVAHDAPATPREAAGGRGDALLRYGVPAAAYAGAWALYLLSRRAGPRPG